MAENSSATIGDVARQAGVSVVAVSRVLNGTAPVIDETAETCAPIEEVGRVAMRQLIREDYKTQKCTLKDSGEWYSRVIETNTVESDNQS
jgi:hypothetical protein